MTSIVSNFFSLQSENHLRRTQWWGISFLQTSPHYSSLKADFSIFLGASVPPVANYLFYFPTPRLLLSDFLFFSMQNTQWEGVVPCHLESACWWGSPVDEVVFQRAARSLCELTRTAPGEKRNTQRIMKHWKRKQRQTECQQIKAGEKNVKLCDSVVIPTLGSLVWDSIRIYSIRTSPKQVLLSIDTKISICSA